MNPEMQDRPEFQPPLDTNLVQWNAAFEREWERKRRLAMRLLPLQLLGALVLGLGIGAVGLNGQVGLCVGLTGGFAVFLVGSYLQPYLYMRIDRDRIPFRCKSPDFCSKKPGAKDV